MAGPLTPAVINASMDLVQQLPAPEFVKGTRSVVATETQRLMSQAISSMGCSSSITCNRSLLD
jgi:hypothetical protein